MKHYYVCFAGDDRRQRSRQRGRCVCVCRGRGSGHVTRQPMRKTDATFSQQETVTRTANLLKFTSVCLIYYLSSRISEFGSSDCLRLSLLGWTGGIGSAFQCSIQGCVLLKFLKKNLVCGTFMYMMVYLFIFINAIFFLLGI